MKNKKWMALSGLIGFSLALPVWAAPPSAMTFLHPDQPVKSAINNPLMACDLNSKLIAAKKKKKTKHNYRTYIPTNVTGDQNNADYADVDNSGLGSSTDYYRKLAVPGLRISNPFAFYLMEDTNEDPGFGEIISGEPDAYMMTEGNLWIKYGMSSTWNGNTSYSDYATGNFSYFSYNGGIEKKARKNPAYKMYNFSVSGNENNADVSLNPNSAYNTTYYYRRLDIPNLKMDNLMDFRIFRKSTSQINGQEAWIPVHYEYFLTDGAIYMAYGNKYGNGTFYDSYVGDYRVFIYSNGKMKKKKLTKQYDKRYIVNVASGASNADITINAPDQKSYFKKLNIPGLKKTDYPNLRAICQSTFNAGIGQMTWSPAIAYVGDGHVWFWYGVDELDGGSYTYTDMGSGAYRVFLYK